MKVMIIDDEKDTCLYLAAVLEDNGYETAILDKEDVAEGILRESPDLILLDIMMPERSGVSIYRQIRLDPRFADIPVVIISGMSRPGTTLESEFEKLVGCDEVPMPGGFIEKPVQLDRMLSIVENALKGRGCHGTPAKR